MPERLRENRDLVRARIADAAARSGRAPAEVTLVCVTKTVEPALVEQLHALGERDFAENRVQVAEPKIAALPLAGARWHFIGHLQRNKVKSALAVCRILHSVDSLRLAESIAAHAGDTPVDVFLEIKTSTEESKLGLSMDEAPAVIDGIRGLSGLNLRGFMTMAPYCPDPADARPFFAALREFRDRMRRMTGLPLPDLSMGMSNDFGIAIEEGATLVRVGSLLFEGVPSAA